MTEITPKRLSLKCRVMHKESPYDDTCGCYSTYGCRYQNDSEGKSNTCPMRGVTARDMGQTPVAQGIISPVEQWVGIGGVWITKHTQVHTARTNNMSRWSPGVVVSMTLLNVLIFRTSAQPHWFYRVIVLQNWITRNVTKWNGHT